MAHTKAYRRACDAISKIPYQLLYWRDFDFDILKYINTLIRSGSKKHGKQVYNDCFIMADTETSKKDRNVQGANHVCAWSIAIRAYDKNIVCLYGARPDEFCSCLDLIHKSMPGDHTLVYFHNMAYDYCFLRQFLFEQFGRPVSQLNTKSYYPINIAFKNGLILRDSLILAQCKLEKWAQDLKVEHQKAVGSWDYDKIRDQSGIFSDDELLYIQNDVLAGVECLDTLCKTLNKRVYSMPYTATGIPRDDIRTIGRKHKARETFKKCAPDWSIQMLLELLFHGGYSHGNKNIAGWIQRFAVCLDFASSYPYSMLVNKFPMDVFRLCHMAITPEQILASADDYAYMFCFSVTKFKLKDPFYPMPMLQKSKLLHYELITEDNGRIMSGAFASIMFNEYDLELFLKMYDVEGEIRISDCYYAAKDYLPRWFTDYIYDLFIKKSELKGVDPVLYAISKARLNSCYGMCVQRPVRIDIQEDYDTGQYYETQGDDLETKYNKYVNNRNNILPYQWGVWVTSESMYRLFKLSECIDYEHGGKWLYSDTDSIYATRWNMDKVNAYNAEVKQKLIERGYPPVVIKGKEYCLGIASYDGCYSKYVVLGAKRYAGRSVKDGELHITVAGVPKAGAKSLKRDLRKFKPGFKFDGATSGKKQHTYYFLKEGQKPYIDDKGNLTGDSIDLEACDYTLDSPYEDMQMELYLPELTEDYE